jgi:type VI secretion system ImpA/VasJ family protein
VALCATSHLVSQSSLHEAEGIRLFLTGLYLPVTQLPSLVREKRMGLKGPPENMRGEIERSRREADPGRLLELALRGLEKHRFWLDLHLAMRDAFVKLGPSASDARTIHEHEVRSLIARLPGLFELEFVDGKPCASSETRAWLSSVSMSPSAAQTGGDAEGMSAFDNARAHLRAGRITDALSLVQGAVNQATDARARFIARLSLAEIAVDGRVKGLGVALLGELIREVIARDLVDWDPSLVARACGLYLRASLDEQCSEARLPFPRAEIHARLCMLDPVAAVAFGTL